MVYNTVILGNGDFPLHSRPVSILSEATHIYCCDGAADRLMAQLGRAPTGVIGDMDSVSQEFKAKFPHLLHPVKDQDTTDLEKTVKFVKERHNQFALTGLFGKREDHSLANFFLIWEICKENHAQVFTDHGVFTTVVGAKVLDSYPGQQVSIFANDCETQISSEGLKWELNQSTLAKPWQGALNEARQGSLRLTTSGKPLLVFQTY